MKIEKLPVIIKLSCDVFFIDSEPGDATRYQYLVYRDGPDEFCISPTRSFFRFPQRLNFWAVRDLEEKKLIELAKKENCNIFTLKECIRTIIKLKENEK